MWQQKPFVLPPDLGLSDRASSVMKFALCKIEEQSEDFSKQGHAGRGVDVGHGAALAGTTGKLFCIKQAV